MQGFLCHTLTNIRWRWPSWSCLNNMATVTWMARRCTRREPSTDNICLKSETIDKMDKLGKMIRITDLRSVWPHEANDFTKWLAQEENLTLLRDAIDIELELSCK